MNSIEDLQDRSEFGKFLTNACCTGTGVELGVFKGEYSKQILDRWKSGKLIGVDCYNHGTEFHLLSEAVMRNQATISNNRYSIIVGDSSASARYVRSELDFVYVDASHAYDDVLRDIKTWRPKIRPGGILCGHDYDLDVMSPFVSMAVNEFMAANRGLKLHLTRCGSWWVKL